MYQRRRHSALVHLAISSSGMPRLGRVAGCLCKQMCCRFLLIGLGTLNVYSIIERWQDRPERNPGEDYNLSKIFLAWFELCFLCMVVVVYLIIILRALVRGVNGNVKKALLLEPALPMLKVCAVLNMYAFDGFVYACTVQIYLN